jgi:D-lactate dehydrogenase
MKIAFFEIERWEEEYLKKFFPKALFFPSRLTTLKLKKIKDVEIISVFIYSQIDKDKIEALPNLKLIATRSTGFDHIDVGFCKQKNIKVANVPTYGENTVAEHAFALILAISRKIIPSVERAKSGDFNLRGLQGFDLRGRTIGIVGTGNIGKHVARIAWGFEMNILAYDLYPDKELIKRFNVKYVKSLAVLFAYSDIITLHLPLNENTYHIVNKELLSNIKRGAYLINTARGGLIDTEALIWALDNNILNGVALDVLEEEPLITEERELLHKDVEISSLRDVIADHLLLRHPKVLVTPHNAFNSKEALERILDTTISNIKNFIKGHPRNLV